jgi:hypothetical protein
MDLYAHISNDPIVTSEKERFAEIVTSVAEKFTKHAQDLPCTSEFANTGSEAEFELALIEYITNPSRAVGYDGCVQGWQNGYRVPVANFFRVFRGYCTRAGILAIPVRVSLSRVYP